jgi:hypothetical protein
MNFLTNDLREFIYLGRNNFLRVGAVAAHIRENVDNRCTLCHIVNADTIHRETFTHLFYMCPVTKLLLRGLTRTVGLSLTLDTPGFIDMYWFGKKNDKFSLSIFLIFELFRYCIWNFKKRKTVPTQTTFASMFVSQLNTIKYVKPALFITISEHFDEHCFYRRWVS